MENASKALIIAGAILLSILIIGLGVYIFDIAKNAMSGINMDEQQVAAYNSKFLSYEGKQSGSKVKTLCDIIRTHNTTNSEDPTQQVMLKKENSIPTRTEQAVTEDTESKTTTHINGIKKDIKAASTYTVTMSYDPSTSLITLITITPPESN